MKKTITLKNLFRPLAAVTGVCKERALGLKAIGLSLAMVLIDVGSASAAKVTTGHTIGGVEVEVRRTGTDVYPVIIFSHGMGGCPDHVDGLLSRLADKGYLVIAPKHRDCFSGSTTPDTPWGEPQSWTDKSNRDRRDDIHAILDALPYSRFARFVENFNDIGCIGHSMGGYTCMGVAGAWPSWHRSEIRAVAALSPWHKPYTEQNRVGDMMNTHTLYQGGTKDAAITPQLMAESGTFEQTTPAKYLQVFGGAGHSAWTDGPLSEQFHEEMTYYIKAFFDAALKRGNKKKLTYTQSESRVVTLEFDHK